jgi:hypothetical protein
LDCGCTLGTTNAQILTVAKALAAGGGVDCVILSHADIHHMGALPILFGKGGLDPVPVICTLPVHKFGQMLLYDLSLNLEMEGSSNAVATDEVAVGVAGKTNLSFTLDDIDVFEVNEAFAAQALAVCRELKLPMERTNPNGSGISLGHPLGATGAMILGTVLDELERTGKGTALVNLCVGAGMGTGTIIERI